MTKKLTTEQFIQRSIEIYGNFYGYSKTKYENSRSKITLECPIHGFFEISPTSHIDTNCGCKKCGIEVTSRKSAARGYNSLKNIAGDLLLSPFEEYASNRSLLTFKCIDCSTEFQTTYFLYKKSNDGKRCINCKQRAKVSDPSTREVFIKQCIEKHGGYYSYELLPEVFSKTEKISVICPKHGSFQTTGDTHLKKGTGCSICKIDKITSITRSSITQFIIKANKVHNFKYNYTTSVYINATTNILIICSKHGEFNQTPDVHLRGSGCPMCKSSAPIGQMINALKQHGIQYSTEHRFKDCRGRGGKPLPFDLYIPKYNICVEYDGPHHYSPVTYYTASREEAEQNFNNCIAHDNIKNIYCEQQNIRLIRIPYTDHCPDATLLKYLITLSEERYMYSFKDLEEDLKKIFLYIESFGYERFAVYSIFRGGTFLGIPTSYHFDSISEFGIANFSRYDGKMKKVELQSHSHVTTNLPIFVMDDLISSGITMKKVIAALTHKYKKAKIHPVVIFGEENDQDVFFLREHPRKWIQFEWEC